MSPNSRIHATVSGRVQGVGFRYFVHRDARQLGLTGWVRNHTDGTVQVVAEGSEQDLNELVSRLNEGPPMAWVKDVAIQWQAAEGSFTDFTLQPTPYR